MTIMIQIQNNPKIVHLLIYQIYLDFLLKIGDDMIMASLNWVHRMGPVHWAVHLEENDRGHVDGSYVPGRLDRKPVGHVMNVGVRYL